MAIETTTITGKIYLPNGQAAADVALEIQLTQVGKVEDGAQTCLISGVYRTKADSAGAVNFPLVPNSGTGAILPTGTKYRVRFTMPDGFTWSELWTVSATPDPVEIGDITREAA